MKIFVTGGTGHIGSTLIPQLITLGHNVSCLTRSDSSATTAKSLGCTPIMGNIDDLSVLSSAAADADAVIHLAFNHEGFPDFNKVCNQDIAAIKAMCDALGSSGKPIICANGTLLTSGPSEDCKKVQIESIPRWKSEDVLLEYAGKGVKAITVRFAPFVHGPTRPHPFISVLIDGSKKAGVAGYIGEGNQAWPACHVEDAAKLLVQVLEHGEAGKAYHAVGEEGIPVKAIAEFIADKLGMEAKSITKEEAMERYGFVAGIMEMDNRTTSDITKKRLGWETKGCSLLEEMESYKY